MSEFIFVRGDRVKIIDPTSAFHGEFGAVSEASESYIRVITDNGKPIKRRGEAASASFELVEPIATPEAKPRTRSTTLTTAEELINGERAATYGDPAENFGRIADLWNAQFGHKLSAKFTASDVTLALVHLKLSRLAVTPDHADSWVDGCGYLALGSELAT